MSEFVLYNMDVKGADRFINCSTHNYSMTKLFGKKNGMYGKKGKLNPSWKGGTSPERQKKYSQSNYKALFRKILKRDNYTCQDCGYRHETDKRLVVHHIKNWAEFPKLRFVSSNLITLCEECHWKRHSVDGTAKKFISKRRPRKKTLVNCLVCGKEFQTKPSRLKQGNGKFCSFSCMGIYRQKAYLGKNNPFYGKHHSDEIKNKLSKFRRRWWRLQIS